MHDLGLSNEQIQRIELTVSCRDADSLPKVPDAGLVRTEDGRRVQVMHDGSLVLADGYYGTWMTEIIRRLRGHHEPQEERVVHAIIERLGGGDRRPVVVELGAFWGYYSIWAMRRTGARAILVEPDPANLRVGQTNVELNLFDATFVNAAVGGEHGSRTSIVCESDGVERELPVVTVPGLVEDHAIDTLDLLLVDVQGAETDVLERMAGWLGPGQVRFLVVSTHHHSISGDPMTHQRCLATIEAAGGHVVAEHTVGESFSGDGLIAASMDPRDRDLVVPVSRARYSESLFGPLEPELAEALARLSDT
ncbi:MAG TPA: FkbM family methyltransferase [Thermoleophilaceae bacterium]|nr:FkbM family methyltransferase [Thermoleophilaceae bacterium]